MKYCESVARTQRWKTRAVMVGKVGVGGSNPVRIQSMTTSPTDDVEATIEQILRLEQAGCEIARVTVQGRKEAAACEAIKNGLLRRACTMPLVADIHFYPPAAMQVIDFVDKVRVNPGNFADKRASFRALEYNDASYALELERVEEKFAPLVQKCRKLGRAMRIGTNHGSLSDRIMNRYGDSPAGMVESALEFARICRKNDFHDFIFSMKSSNPQVMIQAYRMLVAEMMRLEWNYPLHLGVTEAGQGEDGRVKSAMGIGALLLDGLGDTIRVSLTEDCWHEIDPCKRLVTFGAEQEGRGIEGFYETERAFTQPSRRSVEIEEGSALHRDGSVWVAVSGDEIVHGDFFEQLGVERVEEGLRRGPQCVDALVIHKYPTNSNAKDKLRALMDLGIGIVTPARIARGIRMLSLEDLHKERHLQSRVQPFAISLIDTGPEPTAVLLGDEDPSEWKALARLRPSVIIFHPRKDRIHKGRQLFDFLKQEELQIPVILNFEYVCPPEDLTIQAAAEFGALLCDGLGEGVLCEGMESPGRLCTLGFAILQAARMRASKTEFISCPSCGRTLFDLQEVTRQISDRTEHLPGVKIAVMGCIVNGPGEMADADFGYVGSRPGKVDLYVGRDCVEKNIDFAEAEERLVALIKAHGRWVEPDARGKRLNT